MPSRTAQISRVLTWPLTDFVTPDVRDGIPRRAAGASDFVTAAQRRLEERLVREFAPMAYSIASGFYLPGGDTDDAKQEALVGVLRGIRDFDPSNGVPLKSFVGLAVHRQMVTALKAALRAKHEPLTGSVREVRTDDGDVVPALDLVSDGREPYDHLVASEDLAAVVRAFGTLSPLERRWLIVAVNQPFEPGGYAARRGGVRNKRAENAVERARRKLRRAA